MKRIALFALMLLIAASAGCSLFSSGDGGAKKAGKKKEDDVEPFRLAEVKAWELATNINAEISRLTEEDWKRAKKRLIKIGKDAIPTLIPLVESPARTMARLPRSGGNGSYTKGEIVHDVLTEMITDFSNYSGRLPDRSVPAWQQWWLAHKKTLRIAYALKDTEKQ